MAQLDLKVDRRKLDQVRGEKVRIEELFGVVVDVKGSPCDATSSNEDAIFGREINDTIQLRLSSPDSQESVQKAKTFLTAILEEGPDFTVDIFPLTHEQLAMVRKSSLVIQRQSMSVLDLDLNASELCLRGERLNVEAAKQQILMLIMGQKDASTEQDYKQSLTKNISDSNQQHQALLTTCSGGFSSISPHGDVSSLQDKLCNLVLDQDNNVIGDSRHHSPMRSYSLTTDCEYSSSSFSEADLMPRGLSRSNLDWMHSALEKGIDEDFPAVVKDDDGVDTLKEATSEQSSSDEDSGVSVVDKSDPRYETKLEFALKLGYTEVDLDKVINRHGLDCEENRMLQELIESSAGSVQPSDEMVEAVSPSVVAADITSSEVFQGVIKKVKSEDKGSNLRHIVIDGSNVAMSHGKNVFSCRGIKIAVDWFKQRGHEEITVFVPQWRKETSRPDTPITDQHLLLELEKEGIVVFTPARRIKGRRVVCYDDRFVLKLAAETNGIVVSNDNYRDLLNENQEYRKVVDERLLMYTFVNDRFMPPEDPLGRRGPTLDNFLCKEPMTPQALPPDCPYGRKCTYGNKCKYHHPERGSQPHRTVTEVLKEQATLKMQERERVVRGAEQAAVEKGRRGSKAKLMRTRSLVPGEPLPSEKSSAASLLPSALKEPDTDRVKSPTRLTNSSKTANYLSEHRKRLEEHLAMAKIPDPSLPAAQPGFISPTSMVLESSVASRAPEALSPLPMMGSRVSSPSHLHVPTFSSGTQEGPLISGHLLLAKKLSDEASESSFFSNESSSNRTSPVPLGRQEPVPFNTTKFLDRRQSLQEHAQLIQTFYSNSQKRDSDGSSGGSRVPGPARYPSQPAGFLHDSATMAVPQFGAQCQSYPTSEKETSHNTLRRVTSYMDHPSAVLGMEMSGNHREHLPLKPQQSCPSDHLPPNPSRYSGQPFAGKMVRQNSSSDPQLHIASDTFTHPWLPPPSNPPSPLPPNSGLDARGGRSSYGSSEYRVSSEAQQQQQQGLYRSTSVQQQHMFHYQPPYSSPSSVGGVERQYSEGLPSPMDMHLHATQLVGQQGWGGNREVYHPHPISPHSPLTSHTSSPGSYQQPFSPHLPLQQASTSASGWHSHSQMPLSPVQRSFPPNQPILPSDPRYQLYYHLCNVFPEPKVRAAMNRFPDETEPQVVCAHIIQM